MTTDRKVNPVEVSKIKAGDMMAFTYYTKVNSIENRGEKLNVEDLVYGIGNMVVSGKELVANSLSADQYTEEEKISRTQLAEILIASRNTPFTVSFDKEDGSTRVLRGRLIKHEAVMGRSMVEDLDVKEKNKVRLVDHRTLHSLIVNGVKYIAK